MPAEMSRADRLPSQNTLYAGHNLGCGSILQEISHGTGANAFQETFGIVIHINRHDTYLRNFF